MYLVFVTSPLHTFRKCSSDCLLYYMHALVREVKPRLAASTATGCFAVVAQFVVSETWVGWLLVNAEASHKNLHSKRIYLAGAPKKKHGYSHQSSACVEVFLGLFNSFVPGRVIHLGLHPLQSVFARESKHSTCLYSAEQRIVEMCHAQPLGTAQCAMVESRSVYEQQLLTSSSSLIFAHVRAPSARPCRYLFVDANTGTTRRIDVPVPSALFLLGLDHPCAFVCASSPALLLVSLRTPNGTVYQVRELVCMSYIGVAQAEERDSHWNETPAPAENKQLPPIFFFTR